MFPLYPNNMVYWWCSGCGERAEPTYESFRLVCKRCGTVLEIREEAPEGVGKKEGEGEEKENKLEDNSGGPEAAN